MNPRLPQTPPSLKAQYERAQLVQERMYFANRLAVELVTGICSSAELITEEEVEKYRKGFEALLVDKIGEYTSPKDKAEEVAFQKEFDEKKTESYNYNKAIAVRIDQIMDPELIKKSPEEVRGILENLISPVTLPNPAVSTAEATQDKPRELS